MNTWRMIFDAAIRGQTDARPLPNSSEAGGRANSPKSVRFRSESGLVRLMHAKFDFRWNSSYVPRALSKRMDEITDCGKYFFVAV